MNPFLITAASNDSEARLRDVGYFFVSGGFDWDKVAPLAMCLGAVFLFLLLLMLVNKVRYRFRQEDAMMGITSPGEIKDRMETAMSQRSIFELYFERDEEGRRPVLRCMGARIENMNLVLEVTGMQDLSQHWVAKKAECYFQVEYGNAASFHSFSGRVRHIETVRQRCFLTMPLPQILDYRQRRSYLRIIPPEEFLLGAALWHSGEQPQEDQIERITLWPRPSLVYLPMVSDDLGIRDISAGGARVHISRKAMKEYRDSLNTSDQVILMLDLWDPEKSRRLRTWAKCRVQNPVMDYANGGLDLGLQYLAWARPKDGSGGALISWLRLSGSGEIEDLGNWIVRRHLEMFREIDKGMER